MIYLATPYTNEDPAVMEHRYNTAMDVAQYFISNNYVIFSPIVHCHEMAIKYKMNKDYTFWKTYNKSMIKVVKEVWFAAMPGCTKSTGMLAEYLIAKKYHKIIRGVMPALTHTWGSGVYTVSSVVGDVKAEMFFKYFSGEFKE